MNSINKSWYRPEIDGLRALAIIPVLLFHANIVGFSGGYIGVDIFFVISGFLITSIIHRELKNNTFSFKEFWQRRIRRIIPALFVVVMSTLIAGYYIVVFPIDYIDLGQSALAQSAFLANIFFMRNNGYFAGPSENMPLLHTWSLSVEEQFYIGFPILMFLIWKLGKRFLLPTLVSIALLSLAYSYYLLSLNPSDSFTFPFLPNVWSEARNVTAAFYFLPSRAFELLIGAVLAISALSIKNKNLNELASLIGLSLILFSIFSFSRDTPFPGLNALVPTLGTALIIMSNTSNQTMIGKVLSFPMFVWIGLISYSLYLWHWPLLVFGRLYDGDFTLDSTETSVIILLSFVLAYLTYRFVETPFRNKKFLTSSFHVYTLGLLALLIMAFSGWLIIDKKGLPERLTNEARAVALANVDFGDRRDECFVNSFNVSNEPCYIGTKNKERIDFVLWGDSHAAALLPMIEEEAKKLNLSGATFISPACLPISGTITDPIDEKCQNVKTYAQEFIQKHNVRNVILAARWSGYRQLVIEDTVAKYDTDLTTAEIAFREGLEKMASDLKNQGAKLTVIKQVPRHPYFESRTLVYQAASGSELKLKNTNYEEHEQEMSYPNSVFANLFKKEQINLIDPGLVLCPNQGDCLLQKDGVILYENRDHLNKTGAFLLSETFRDLFENF